MCDGASAVMAIMAIAGTAMQVKANNERKADMRRLNRQMTEKTDKHYAESKQYLDENQGAYEMDKVNANMESAAAGRQAKYADADRNAPRANEAMPGAGGNAVVMDAFARALEGAGARAAEQGAARAELASFGDFMTNTAIANRDRSNNIGMVGSFLQGDSNLFGLELQNAINKPRSSATFGNLLTSLAGSVGGGMSGMGGNTTVPVSGIPQGNGALNLFAGMGPGKQLIPGQ